MGEHGLLCAKHWCTMRWSAVLQQHLWYMIHQLNQVSYSSTAVYNDVCSSSHYSGQHTELRFKQWNRLTLSPQWFLTEDFPLYQNPSIIVCFSLMWIAMLLLERNTCVTLVCTLNNFGWHIACSVIRPDGLWPANLCCSWQSACHQSELAPSLFIN